MFATALATAAAAAGPTACLLYTSESSATAVALQICSPLARQAFASIAGGSCPRCCIIMLRAEALLQTYQAIIQRRSVSGLTHR